MRRPSVIALIAITIVFVASTLPANAGSQADEIPGLTTVIALDTGAASSELDIAMMETTAMTLVGNLTAGDITVTEYGTTVGQPVSATAGTEAVAMVGNQLNLVKSSKADLKSDQFEVLTDTFSYLARIDAVRGSRVFLITPGRILGESENTAARFKSVADLYANEGWIIDVATLASTEAATRSMLSDLATGSGGRYFDLGTPAGLQELLFDASGVSLDTVIDSELNGTEVKSTFEVAPMTDSARVAFLRFNPDTSIALYKPNGTQVTASLSNVEVITSPNVVIYNISEPQTGTWIATGTGQQGKLVTGVDARTPLRVELFGQPPLPIGEPGLLTAAATIGTEPVVVAGAHIDAAVRQSDGFTNVYKMNDDGVAGDVTAGDGIYSVRLPAPAAQGINDVSLTMTWADLKSEITGVGSYKTEQFPEIRVTRMFDINGHEGDESIIATIESFVGEFPYLASPDEFTVKVVGVDGQFDGRVMPRSEPEPGKSFAFDVLAVVPATGDYSVSVSLNTAYLGRTFVAPSPAISTNATITAQPFLVAGLPIWAWSIIGIVAVAGLAIVVIQSRKVKPYGYIYDDQDVLVADFTNLRRRWTRRFLSTDTVLASEVSSLPFAGGTFKFTRHGVLLMYGQAEGQPSLRVNSRPAPEVVELGYDVWLGVSGKLLTFTREKRPRTSLAFAPADD
jgi:hypothetical protein